MFTWTLFVPRKVSSVDVDSGSRRHPAGAYEGRGSRMSFRCWQESGRCFPLASVPSVDGGNSQTSGRLGAETCIFLVEPSDPAASLVIPSEPLLQVLVSPGGAPSPTWARGLVAPGGHQADDTAVSGTRFAAGSPRTDCVFGRVSCLPERRLYHGQMIKFISQPRIEGGSIVITLGARPYVLASAESGVKTFLYSLGWSLTTPPPTAS